MQTLTMLFTDIEGSTRLLRRLGEAYQEVLTQQRSILRAAFRNHAGREMGTEGDSFFVVFDSASHAVAAAAEAQRRLAKCSWPEDITVGVRMGIHTGEPVPYEDGYVGMDVHRAARISGCAHGGQVLLSATTHRLVTSGPSVGVSFLDLGRYRLKDLPASEHLYQLAADDLPRTFPPLRTLGAGSNLPLVATSLIGRDTELRELHELVLDDAVRLVTLTGPGGSGKTRLAIELARTLDSAFSDGVYFVPLESATSLDAAWTTVADAVGVSGENRAPQNVLDDIAVRHALLVLDNLEQLQDASTLVDSLLAAAPSVRIVATSRRPLYVTGEREQGVPPLTLPRVGEGYEELQRSGAVALFVERARMVRRDFALTPANTADVGEICRRLDGLPLAIELAAARVKLLGTRGLRARLDSSLELGSSQHGRPGRQRTLRATIEWSHDLLAAGQQQIFRQLGVFRGDFDLPALGAVVSADGDPVDELAALVDASLVAVASGPDDEPRFRLLETIAAYACDRLTAAGELEEVRRRHAEHYLGIVETEAPRLRSGQFVSARDRIEAELENLRAALAWALQPDEKSPVTSDRLMIGLQLCEQLGWFWYACGYQREGHDWLDRAVTAASGQESRELTNSLHALGVLVLQRGEAERARDALRRCLDFWRRDGNPYKIARELNSLGVVHRSLGEPDIARQLFTEAITVSRQTGDREREASALSNLANVESETGNDDLAIRLLNEALDLDRQLEDDWGVGADMVNLASTQLRAGRVDEAATMLADNTSSIVGLNDPDLTVQLIELFSALAAERHRAPQAARLLGAARALRRAAELPIAAPDAAALQQSLDRAHSQLSSADWDANVARGEAYTVTEALEEALRNQSADDLVDLGRKRLD
jgi:predicted ATPase/class 3 adenylate cyclase